MTAVLMALALPLVAQPSDVHVRVKTDAPYEIVAPIFDAVFVDDCHVLDFTATRAVHPAGPEPLHTADPLVRRLCPLDGSPVFRPWSVYHLQIHTASLSDVGTYRYTCTGAWSGINPSACLPSPCRAPACAGDGRFQVWSATFRIFVDNAPPAGRPEVTPATRHVGDTLTFTSHADNPDRTGFTVEWRLTPPAGAVARLADATQPVTTMMPRAPADIGPWSGVLRVVDHEGELAEFPFTFVIENRPPEFEITGPRTITALETISLEATPGTDPDGDPVTRTWQLDSAPRGASMTPGPIAADRISIITAGPQDVGDWRFVCTQSDGRTGSTPVRREVTVTVRPRSPTIMLDPDPTAMHQVHVGDPRPRFTDRMLNDAYGRPLRSFRWDVMHVPMSAAVGLMDHFCDGPSCEFPTTPESAGTWILRLTVTDDSGTEAHADVSMLVDGPPTARILAPDAAENFVAPLDLTGDRSSDPDSPEGTERGHFHRVVPLSVSDPIRSYQWRVLAVPEGVPAGIRPGTVDDIFGIRGTLANLRLPPRTLTAPGDWQFGLEVVDAERNHDITTHWVHITDVQVPPVAQLGPSSTFVTGAAGVLDEDITLDASDSYDPDDLLTASRAPRLGIEHYRWEIVSHPPLCTTLPTFGDTPGIRLFARGDTLPGLCQGIYTIAVTVTDNDTPTAHTASAETRVSIANCEGTLCIDFPRTADPYRFRYSNQTDALIFYHLSSTLYDRMTVGTGPRVRLEIVRDGEVEPAFSYAWDVDVLPNDRGGVLVLHWAGNINRGGPPPSGVYSVTLALIDADENPIGSPVTEPSSIFIQTLRVEATAATSRFVDQDALAAGRESVRIGYAVTGQSAGTLGFDAMRYSVYTSRGDLVAAGRVPATTASGAFEWNGITGGGAPLPVGEYRLELEIHEAGAVLARSELKPFTVYRIDANWRGAPAPSTEPGAAVLVNNDDDDLNGTADLSEVSPAEGDLFDLQVSVPRQVRGTLVIDTPDLSPPFTLWSTAAKGLRLTLPQHFDLPLSTPVTLFVEGIRPGYGSLTAHIEAFDGSATPPRSINFDCIEIALVNDTSGDFQTGAGDVTTLFVRPGLWNGAYRVAADANGAAGTLYNQNDAAALASAMNPENFVGRDSRRFYFRVTDRGANTNATSVDDIAMDRFKWWTREGSAAVADQPLFPTATLRETAAASGVFASTALMLVRNQADAERGTAPGLAGQTVVRRRDEPDHRIRSITHVPRGTREPASPDGSLLASYEPAGLPSQIVANFAVFNRAPDERRSITIHWFNFQDTSMGIAPIPETTINQQLDILQQVYAAIGIRVNVVHNPATDVINLPAGSGVNLMSVTSDSGGRGALTPSAAQQTLISMVTAVSPAAATGNVIHVLFVGGVTQMNRGESFPDGWIPAGSPARNFVFISARAPGLDITLPHEVGHMLLNEMLSVAEAANGGHYGGLQREMNLMCTEPPPGVSIPNCTSEGRLWEDAAHAQQLTRIRGSRYLSTP